MPHTTPPAENDVPTCRRCYAETLTPAERERFYAEPVTSCVYLCPEHQAAYERVADLIDWSKVKVVAPRATRPIPPAVTDQPRD